MKKVQSVGSRLIRPQAISSAMRRERDLFNYVGFVLALSEWFASFLMLQVSKLLHLLGSLLGSFLKSYFTSSSPVTPQTAL